MGHFAKKNEIWKKILCELGFEWSFIEDLHNGRMVSNYPAADMPVVTDSGLRSTSRRASLLFLTARKPHGQIHISEAIEIGFRVNCSIV